MRTLQRISVPTGDIVIVSGEFGKLELLSLGDYGSSVNLNQGKPVPSGLPLLPLEEKWVITISTQYGCSMGCSFCDVPKVGPGKNATLSDLMSQVDIARELHPEVKATKRLNVHFARMGEPTWNPAVIQAGYFLRDWFKGFQVHPVVSTMMPRNNKDLFQFLNTWLKIKNDHYQGEAGLQLSINSTNDLERDQMFGGNATILASIASMLNSILYSTGLRGRKITLNFAVAEYEIDPEKLLHLGFDPDHFVVKLTPMHKTSTALEHGIRTMGDYTSSYPYEHHAENLRKAGYDVLVFIASEDEDLGRITCGNAILSGTKPLVPHTIA